MTYIWCWQLLMDFDGHQLILNKYSVWHEISHNWDSSGTNGQHTTGSALISDWFVNFLMVVYENFSSCTLDRKFWPNFKKNLIDNHYKTIYEPVRSEYSSCRVDRLSAQCRLQKIFPTRMHSSSSSTSHFSGRLGRGVSARGVSAWGGSAYGNVPRDVPRGVYHVTYPIMHFMLPVCCPNTNWE